MKNEYKHNDDGTTHIFIETKCRYFPGKHTIIIDTADWERLKEYRWHLFAGKMHRYPYACTTRPDSRGGWRSCGKRRKRKRIYLHHAVMGNTKKGTVVDHINHNGLDNRKENLRAITHAQSMQNTRSHRGGSSKYKGVSRHRQSQKWRAMVNNEYLGLFECEHQAALAYNKRAIEVHGEFAYLNVVPQEYLAEVNNANP